MKTTVILSVLILSLTLTGCKQYRDYLKQKKAGTITTQSKAYKKFMNELDSIIADQMTSYTSKKDFKVENNGYFKVTNISEEQAPYIIGQIVELKNNKITFEQYPSLLTDIDALDKKINFDSPEVSLFVNKSASINVAALDKAKVGMEAEDKMSIVYDKAFSAVPKLNWFDFKKWNDVITTYNLSESYKLWVISSVQVKKFTYAIYEKFGGTFSVTPTPVVAIDGKVFQESGGERNVYEVFIQLKRLKFPQITPDVIAQVDSLKNNNQKGIDEGFIDMNAIFFDDVIAKEGESLDFTGN